MILELWRYFCDDIIRNSADIILVTVFYYSIFSLFRAGLTSHLIRLFTAAAVIFSFAFFFKLKAVGIIFSEFWSVGVLALVVILQPEIRHGLLRFGAPSLAGIISKRPEREAAVEEVIRAALVLSRKSFGALIVIERNTSLDRIIESGSAHIINGRTTTDILVSIFNPESPLHDGAVVIRDNQLVAASCILPIKRGDEELEKRYGTRHRAALAVSEETDAVVVVVSEETGNISIAVNGRFSAGIDPSFRDRAGEILRDLLLPLLVGEV